MNGRGGEIRRMMQHYEGIKATLFFIKAKTGFEGTQNPLQSDFEWIWNPQPDCCRNKRNMKAPDNHGLFWLP